MGPVLLHSLQFRILEYLFHLRWNKNLHPMAVHNNSEYFRTLYFNIGILYSKRAIMDFNGDLLTRRGKTYLRAFLSWITDILHCWCPKCCLLNNQGIQYLRRGDEQIVMANPLWLFGMKNLLVFQHIPNKFLPLELELYILRKLSRPFWSF